MVAHRETLRRLVCELTPDLVAAQLVALYYHRNRQLFLRVETASGVFSVEVWLRAGLTTLCCRPPRWELPGGLVPWAEELWGSFLTGVLLHPSERWIELHSSRGDRLILFLFGTAHSGALLLTAEGTVRAVPLAAQHTLEALLREGVPQRLEWRAFGVETPLYRALARSTYQLGTFYAREVCHRCGVKPERVLGELTEEEHERIETELPCFLNELTHSPTVFLLKRGNAPPLLSLLPLREYPEVIASFASVNEAVAERVRRTLLVEGFQRERAELRQRLERHCRQITHHLTEAQEHLQRESFVELYRRWGHMLLSHPEPRRRGLEELEVRNWHEGGDRIPLDPALTVYENAENYFRQARRLKASLERARHRIPLLQQLQEELLQLESKLMQAASHREMHAVARRLEELFPPREIEFRTGERVRVFLLGQGFRLYVGKDAQSNDALTFGFARPHDLFLHVRGGAGSHGILRGQHRGQLPPVEVLQRAAAIVAHYSELRTATIVPVVYTWRKYVRKLKGYPGAVRLEREELLWVQPMAPMAWESQ